MAPRLPRVLILPVLFQAEPWNGIMEHLRILLTGLDGGIAPVIAVRPSDGEQTAALAAQTGAETLHLNDARGGREIGAACHAARIDLVHIHSPVVPGVPRLAVGARRAGAAVTVTWHQVQLAPSRLPRRIVARAAQRLVFPHSSAVSRAVRASVAGLAGLDASRVRLIYNGVEAVDPGPEIALPGWWTPEATWCAYIGRLAAEKGVDRSLRALALASARAPCLRLAVIGGGYERERLEALARDLDLEERVVFAGHVEQARRLMRPLRFLVHTPDFEGLPYSLVEALQAGLPVIATDVPGGVPEVVDQGVTGLLVPAGDIPALADAMVRLATDEEFRARLSAGAHARYLDRFTAEGMVYAVGKMYEDVLHRGLPT